MTHNLQDPDMVPVLFATSLVENNICTSPHTHFKLLSVALSVALCVLLKHSNNRNQTTSENLISLDFNVSELFVLKVHKALPIN